ncbi:hypothetical protein SDC9_149579 [bioreactor metagenome]|uniref:Uncharacterized protein n=1 Tax=bioreactor metagenome TaxID=1076179 RepID=A0A645EP91_9ZZZZ
MRKLHHVQIGLTCQHMVLRQAGHQGFGSQRENRQIIGRKTDVQKTYVEVARRQRPQLLAGGHLVHAQFHVGTLQLERPAVLRHLPVHHRPGDAHIQPPLGALRHAAHHIGGALHLRQHLARLQQKGFARRSEGDVLGIALHQHDAQVFLQRFERRAQWRLGDEQALRCAAEMALLGQHHEVAQQMGLHERDVLHPSIVRAGRCLSSHRVLRGNALQ